MNFYSRIFSKNINIFGIDDFEVKNWHNVSQLKNVYRSLFSDNETLYFSFRREENLTDERELRQLKIEILETFNNDGEYVVLRQLDEARFDSVARIVVKESTFEFLFDIWNYFYSCAFFRPKDGFAFSNFIDFEKRNKFEDKLGGKLLTQGYADFICMKALGGEGLIISYRKGYQLPDLKKAALDTPDKDQIFR